MPFDPHGRVRAETVDVSAQRLSDKLLALSCKRCVLCSSNVVQRGLLGAMAFVVERSAIRRRWGCQPMAGQSWGSLAVAAFFAISGYLVCSSWTRDP